METDFIHKRSLGKRRFILLAGGLLVFLLANCMVFGSENTPSKVEIREAFESFLTVIYQAELTYDPTELPEVATGEALRVHRSAVEGMKRYYGNSTLRSSREFEIVWIEVLASGPNWAVIEVKENYLPFDQDLTTGEKAYGGRTEFYWNIQRYLLVKEDNIWKVARNLETVSWSG